MGQSLTHTHTHTRARNQCGGSPRGSHTSFLRAAISELPPKKLSHMMESTDMFLEASLAPVFFATSLPFIYAFM